MLKPKNKDKILNISRNKATYCIAIQGNLIKMNTWFIIRNGEFGRMKYLKTLKEDWV